MRPPKPVVPLSSTSQATSVTMNVPLKTYLDGEEKKCLDEDLKQPKNCMPTIFRSKKVRAADVASIGQASDTIVVGQIPGRSVHEQAKEAMNCGQYNESLKLFEAILSAQVHRFGPCHASVAAAMHNCAVCKYRMGDYVQAERMFIEALKMRVETLGKNHVDVAATLSKLGSTQISLKKLDQAHISLKESLRVARVVLGDKHKLVAQIQAHLAALYYRAGELMAAEYALNDALGIYRNILPSVDDKDACIVQIADTLCNIGTIQSRRKRHEEAIASFSEALNLQSDFFVPDHIKVISTLDNLAYSHVKNKQYIPALSCYQTMLRGQVSQNGEFSQDCLTTFRKQMLMYKKLKQFDQAYNDALNFFHLVERSPHSQLLQADVKKIIDSLYKKAKF